ncbi:hypothetical protein SBA1_480051 [Candidatus Sulfotelmatobacter kueseliae]|uniref:Uncharacterized protein n=1 Tax=Candidatus Sulfotelmatobacter kueseliae TaxID=2042962 RepID=A0A2U3KU52_9BACT|nr:hypothetical protein SBA1_480051 [Candidatus Sulfotelmatobacter kueseliae]
MAASPRGSSHDAQYDREGESGLTDTGMACLGSGACPE